MSAMVAEGSALRGAFGGPVGVFEDEDERCDVGGGLRVAIVRLVCWRKL